MNPSDWIYHLSLRTALYEIGNPDRRAQPTHQREPSRSPRLLRVAAAGLAMLVPTLLLASALMGV